jgi:sigma-B regulation protein RsbU (phosphoserine phosphatase)
LSRDRSRLEAAFATILALNAELASLTRELSCRNREIERARARAEAAEREATRRERLQEQLAAIVAHDLRTPLSVVTLSAAMLKRRGIPEAAAAVDRIAASAARMKEIVGDLLEFTDVRHGLGRVERSAPTEVGDLCRAVVHEHRALRPDARIEVRTEGDAYATVDGSRIAQMVANLVGNALQHGDGSGVDVVVTGSEDEVSVAVHNRGRPIPAQLVPELFEPFRQGPPPPAGSRPRGSVGLGLFIVGEIVHAHGGTIEIESGEETGTCFTVRLPRTPRAPGEALAGSRSHGRGAP